MTNFDPESQNELNDRDDQIDYDLRSCNDKEDPDSAQITNQDVTSMAYLRNTYNHLHENQFLKLNKLLCDNENEAIKLKRKQRINLRKGLYAADDKSMETEDDIDTYASESSFSSENSCDNNEISEITKDMKECHLSGAGRHEKVPAKPIITFTPVRSADDELNERFHSSRSSDRPPSASSGSSSPLLEVPVVEFADISTEMMRPPING
ncbi:uncharacterized protein LOC135840268 [Planococcus citri]|uniref:uncharacterized protein LOC135840268 n=1 Tax=Planococcus citri TaxID=170843 RepID=UPI0031F8B3E9